MKSFGSSLLVVGGARSGKSRHAQALAEATGCELVFIATAQAFDAEMTERIARHRADRGAEWRTVEAPIDLVEALLAENHPGRTILVDCLTLWASNLLLSDADVDACIASLEACMPAMTARVVLVSNEVGFGIVPDNALARRFRDIAGTLNQRVAAVVEQVDLVVAGLPQRIKG